MLEGIATNDPKKFPKQPHTTKQQGAKSVEMTDEEMAEVMLRIKGKTKP